MTRDPSKLKVFVLADALVEDVYRSTVNYPIEERLGLQSQIRRAAVSVAANLVEGCARPSEREYLHFIAISLGSASETRYLIGLAARLGFTDPATAATLIDGYSNTIRAMQGLLNALTPTA